MAERLLPEARRRRAGTEADGARIAGRLVERADDARRGSRTVAHAAGIGDFLGGLADNVLLFRGHGRLSSEFGRAANAARRSLAQKQALFIKWPWAGNNEGFCLRQPFARAPLWNSSETRRRQQRGNYAASPIRPL